MSAEPRKLATSYSFHFLWTSTFASGFADRLAMLSVQVMLGYGVVDGVMAQGRLPDSSIVAGIGFFFFLPYVIWGPFAGWLADKLPRKWLMFIADESRAVIILFAYTLLPADSAGAVPGMYEPWVTVGPFELAHAWKAWGLMFAIGWFAATFTPARNSVIPNVVGYRVLQRANSVIIGMGIIGNLFGFVVGGPLSESALRICIFCSAMCYLLPGFMWPFLNTPVKRHERPGVTAGRGPLTPVIETHRGAQYILTHRPLIALTGAFVLLWGGSQLIMAAGSAIAVDVYGGNVSDFAMIGGGFGLGMLIGAVVLGATNSRVGSELIMIVSMIGAAVFLSLLVVVPFKWLGVPIAVLCGFFGGSLLITVNTMVQRITADGYRGRVMAFKDLAGDSAAIVVNFIIWRLPEADSYVLNAAHVFAALLIITALYGFRRYVLSGPLKEGSRWLNFFWRFFRLYAVAVHRVRVIGAHRVPREGPALLVINHTAGVDPVLVQTALPRVIRWMMARDMMLGWASWYWRLIGVIPVDREGNETSSARGAIEALRRGDAVGIFPEAGIATNHDEPLPFKAGLALIASRGKAPIVPVHISGTPEGWGAYKALFIPSRSTVVFGEPVDVETLRAEATETDAGKHAALAEAIRRRVFALAPDAGRAV